ncbi:hypothetical protein WJX74_004970 [Apatococcus lobatus]|uniref:Nucleolar complex protein 2 homolog n=1 Tax=Apatococcus lobatus TaxID=904363 RepID=A0AAW1QKV8_9CHLO
MAKAKKSTKKFKKKGLGEHTSRRKVIKKKEHTAPVVAAKAGGNTAKEVKGIPDMELDEFLDGGFEAAGAEASGSEDNSSMDGDLALDAGDGLHLEPTPEMTDAQAAGSEDLSDEDDPVGQHNRKLKTEMSQHEAQLAALRERDPEFYAYLQQTDQELLDFKADEDESDQDEETEADAGEDGAGIPDAAAGRQTDAASTSGRMLVTSQLVDRWCRAAQEGATMGTMRQLLRAFRAACHFGDTEEEVAAAMRIASSHVFNQLLMFLLQEGASLFARMLGFKAGELPPPDKLTKSDRWRKCEPLAKSFLGNTLHLLSHLTESGSIAYVLQRMRALVPLLAASQRLQRKLLQHCLTLFGSDQRGPALQALLLIRQMALLLPDPALDLALKGTYRTFVRNARFVTPDSAPHIAFMAACVVEMHSLDMGAAYEHAFSAVRQLAQLLRAGLAQRSQQALQEVYSWPTLHALELWARLLSSLSDRAELKPLVYPVVQLLLGVAGLVPSPRYFPLRLRCIASLSALSAATGVFIPLAPPLLEVLTWSELRKAPAAQQAGKPPDLMTQLRAGQSQLRTPSFQEAVVNLALEQLAGHMAQWSCHIAFPEMAHLSIHHLRKFVKQCPVERFRAAARSLLDAAQRNSAWLAQKRSSVDFSPKDAQQIAEFLQDEKLAGQAPLQKFHASLVERSRQQRALRSAKEVNVATAAQQDMSDASDDEDLDAPISNLQQAEATAAVLPAGGLNFRAQIVAGKAARKKAAAEAEQEAAAAAAAAPSAEDDARHGSDMDILEDYVLSDDEDDDAAAAEAGKKKEPGHRRSGKQAPRGKHRKLAGKVSASKGSKSGPSKQIPKAKRSKQKR